jgi:hypothetical protein
LSDTVVDPGQQVRIWVLATDNVGVTGLSLTIDGQPVPLDSQIVVGQAERVNIATVVDTQGQPVGAASLPC